MSNRKVEDFVSSALNGIMRESREERAYELGLAYGYLNFYMYFNESYGKEEADKVFESILNGSDNYNVYFKKMKELYEQENITVDELIDKLEWYKSN